MKKTPRPSAHPTQFRFPTSMPSSRPSSTPTLSLETLWIEKMEILARNVTVGDTQDIYYELKVRDKIADYGGCTAWQSYSNGDLYYSSLFKQAANVSLAVDSSYSPGGVRIVTCSQATVATQIVNALVTPNVVTSTFICQGHSWKVRDCAGNGVASLCADCDNPCNINVCTSASPFYVGPCNTAGVSCASPSASARILSVAFTDTRGHFPAIVSSSHNTARTTSNISLALSDSGTVSCGIFSSGQAPTSVSEITIQGRSVSISGASAHLVATNLIPASNYDWYCVTTNSLGAAMTQADILNTKLSVRTACCRTIAIDLGVSFVFQDTSSVDALTITVDTMVSSGLTLEINALAETGSVLTRIALVTLRNSLTASVSILPANTAIAGKVTVQATVLNNTAYSVAFRNEVDSFLVLTRSQVPPAPTALSAVFSSSGNNILVTFDSQTNQMGSKGSAAFVCSTMFTVTDTAAGSCQWRSSSAVVYTPPPNSILAPGSTMLFLGNKVKARCTLKPESGCNGWTFSDAKILTVQAASNGLAPTVRLSTPTVLYECNDLSMDFSSSTGSGNRAWTRVSFAVNGFNASSALRIQTFLNQLSSFSPPIIVPSRFLSLGYYNIKLTLCNFLGRCGVTENFIALSSVTIPSVSVAGSPLRTVSRSQAVQIDADSFVKTCSGNSSRANLVNSWKVYLNNFLLSSIQSSSLVTDSFKLDAYTLVARSVYTIKFTSLYTLSGKSSMVNVQVYVQPGNLVAVIKQSSSFGLRLGQNVTLDTSQSFDQDVSPLLRTTSGLSFFWSCAQVLPVANATCAFALDPLARQSARLPLYAGYETANSSSVFSLTVFDSARSATASTTVQVLPPSSPITRLEASHVGKFNVFEKLKIAAYISTMGTVVSAWSVNDTSVSLSAGSVTPLNRTLIVPTRGRVIDTTFVFNFALETNTLPPNTYLTFTLTTALISGASVTASVVVITNGNPVPGEFTVTPSNGIALIDTFLFTAGLWQDDDLPLTYSFGFLAKTVSANFLPMRDPLELTYGSFNLPVGSDARNYSLVCAVRIFDAYAASVTVTKTVTVIEAPVASLQQFLIANPVDRSDLRTAQRLLSVVSEQLNSVSCQNSPLCANLNRLDCARVPNTCGRCLDGYVGENGDSNSRCYDASSVSASASRRPSSLRSGDTTWFAHSLNIRALAVVTCTTDSACPAFQSCNTVTSQCYTPVKQCASDCFSTEGHGQCEYYRTPVSAEIKVSTCLLSDYSCVAKCSCALGWAGPSCTLNATDASAAIATRLLLLTRLNDLVQEQDVSATALSSYVSSIVSIAFNPEEISPSALEPFYSVIEFILAGAGTVIVPAPDLEELFDTMDGVYPVALTNSTLQSAYPQYSNQQVVSLAQDLVAEQAELLQTLLALLQTNAVAGENVYSFIRSGDIRVKQLATSSYEIASSLSTEVATTSLEVNGLAPVSSLRFSGAAADQNVFMSLLQLQYSNMLLSSYLMNSHPLFLQVADAANVCGVDGKCEFTFDIVNVEPKAYVFSNPNPMSFVTNCLDGIANATTYKCADGLEVTAVCSGNFTGYVTSDCPYYTIAPTCGVVLNEVYSTDSCRTLSFTNTTTQCACNISADALTFDSFGRRRMASAGSGAEVTSQSTRTLVSGGHTSTLLVPSSSPRPFAILGLEAWELWIVFAAIVFVMLMLMAYVAYRQLNLIEDTDSQYEVVDYITYAKLLRMNILELLEINRQSRENMLFSPLQMTDAVALLIEEKTSKGSEKKTTKTSVGEVEDLLFVQEKLREENEKLPYWKFVVTSVVEAVEKSQKYTSEDVVDAQVEELVTKYKAELIDASGPLDLPPRFELSDGNDPMLQAEQPPKRLSAKFASLGFRSPSLFRLDSKRAVGEFDSSQHYTDIYSPKNGDETFSFAYNKKDIAHAPQSRYVRSHSAFLKGDDSFRGTYALDFSAEMCKSDSSSFGLYEATSVRSFHLGNSASDDGEMKISENEVANQASDSAPPPPPGALSSDPGHAFFSPVSDYGHFGENNGEGEIDGSEAESKERDESASDISPSKYLSPLSGSFISRSARTERWSSLLEKARRRSSFNTSPVLGNVVPPPPPAKENDEDELVNLEGGMMSPKNSPSAGSVKGIATAQQPYLVRTKSGSAADPQSNMAVMEGLPTQVTRRIMRTGSFASAASKDTLTTAPSMRNELRGSRRIDAKTEGKFLTKAESAADLFDTESLSDFLVALKQEVPGVAEASDHSDTIGDNNSSVYDLSVSEPKNTPYEYIAPKSPPRSGQPPKALSILLPRRRASSPAHTATAAGRADNEHAQVQDIGKPETVQLSSQIVVNVNTISLPASASATARVRNGSVTGSTSNNGRRSPGLRSASPAAHGPIPVTVGMGTDNANRLSPNPRPTSPPRPFSPNLQGAVLVLKPHATPHAALALRSASPAMGEPIHENAFRHVVNLNSRASPVPPPSPAPEHHHQTLALPSPQTPNARLRHEMAAYKEPHHNFTSTPVPALRQTGPLRSPAVAGQGGRYFFAGPDSPPKPLSNKPTRLPFTVTGTTSSSTAATSPSGDSMPRNIVTSERTPTSTTEATAAVAEEPFQPAKSWYVRANNVSLLAQRFQSPASTTNPLSRRGSFRSGATPPARPLFQVAVPPSESAAAVPTATSSSAVTNVSVAREPRATSAAMLRQAHVHTHAPSPRPAARPPLVQPPRVSGAQPPQAPAHEAEGRSVSPAISLRTPHANNTNNTHNTSFQSNPLYRRSGSPK